MAIDALKNITTNIPNWLTRLDDLAGQIEKRQVELAAITPEKNAETRSLRNKGSQESLKPKDDGPSNIPETVETPTNEHFGDTLMPSTPSQEIQKLRLSPSSPGPGALPASQKPPPRDVTAAAHSRARAQVKKRVRSASVVSADNNGATPAYRTRTMIIVYYDSYVQGFFDDLVRFVSSSRNLMRKAKMAAKVAQIKKMAETNVSDDDDEDNLPSLRYMSTRRFGPMASISRPGFGPPGANDQPDVYDSLDKGLEFVQSTCEHGAHQFLRDADCNDEIKKIQNRLLEVIDMALTEMERIQREEPELAKEKGELTKARTMRSISMRRELSTSYKDKEHDSAKVAVREDTGKLEVAKSARSKNSLIEPDTAPLEADDDEDADEGISVDFEMPKMQYRSTRIMRGH